MEALKIIKGLVLLFLLIGLSISSLIEIKKFFGKKTMVTIYNEPQDKLSLPLITICGNPPLKDEFFTPGLAFSYLNFTPIDLLYHFRYEILSLYGPHGPFNQVNWNALKVNLT